MQERDQVNKNEQVDTLSCKFWYFVSAIKYFCCLTLVLRMFDKLFVGFGKYCFFVMC